jgi:hypothetical protein
MRDQLTILNSFVHDVATGTWISSLALFALLRAELGAAGAAGAALPFAARLEHRFTWFAWGALAVIVATGLVRMLTWKVFGWTSDVERSRIRLLKIKHALLGVVFVGGTAWQAALVYGA